MRMRGVTYLIVLFLVAMISAASLVTATLWSQHLRRIKERQLLWVGEQYRSAIQSYYLRSPGTVKRYPQKLEDLLEDQRYLFVMRHLRRIYRDPMTGETTWGIVRASDGGIKGVFSLSRDTPIKQSGFSLVQQEFENSGRYSDWRFRVEP